MIFGYAILATALLLSLTAEYYSIAGLTAIFSAATVPVIIMGVALGLGKLVGTVWLHNNWKRVPILFKVYLVPAIAFLMFLTSIGTFGYLSKAHLEQSTMTGDSEAQVQLFDDKIKTEKDNIESARNALKQMDATVNLTMDRGTDGVSVQKAANLRKRQEAERATLQAGITQAQKNITALQEQRAPLAMQARKIEAEVGPLKYIAALLYGDNPSTNLLERAVRWVIILIVLVFDPLALCLILAANLQLDWARHGKAVGFAHNDEDDTPPLVPEYKGVPIPEHTPPVPTVTQPAEEEIEIPKVDIQLKVPDLAEDPAEDPGVKQFFENGKEIARRLDSGESISGLPDVTTVVTVEEPKKEKRKYNRKKKVEVPLPPDVNTEYANINAQVVAAPTPEVAPSAIEEAVAEVVVPEVTSDNTVNLLLGRIANLESQLTATIPNAPAPVEIEVVEPIEVAPTVETHKEVIVDHIDPNTRIKTQKSTWVPIEEATLPSFAAEADNAKEISADFGTEFPKDAKKGDMYLRVDFLPAKLHKFNGVKWMEVDKTATDSYAFNTEYVKYLIEKLNSGEYSIDDLTETEQDQISEYLNNND